MAAPIPHPEAFVQGFLQPVDIISQTGQNKNTLVPNVRSLSIRLAGLGEWIAVHGFLLRGVKSTRGSEHGQDYS